MKVEGWEDGCLIKCEDPGLPQHKGPVFRGHMEKALRHNY